jgi:membrane protein implicated in regulation of membrane protease activity
MLARIGGSMQSLGWTSWILIVVGAILVILEFLLGAMSGFDLLLLGAAILVGGIVGILSGTPVAGIATAVVLSIVYATFGRRRIHRRRPVPRFPFQRK